jgi:proline dehydrogenase
VRPATVVEGVLRRGILAAADDARVRRFVSAHGMRLGGARFVAGETPDACVSVLRGLNERGLHANTTLLGESVHNEAQVAAVVVAYEGLLARLVDEGLRANVALKLTHLGLELGEDLAYENVRLLVERAEALGSFIRIDMEQSAFVDSTLGIYRRLREAGLVSVGCVLQSYPRKADVDAAYVRLLEASLAGPGYTAVATHDVRLIEQAVRFAEQHGIGRDRFEFQLLYGVRPQLQLELVRRGFKVLVATPFGPEWYPYLMRRLAERPANALFLLRNLVRR